MLDLTKIAEKQPQLLDLSKTAQAIILSKFPQGITGQVVFVI